MHMCCPNCGAQHLDEGEWRTRSHKTHLCLCCDSLFRPFDYPTVGVEMAKLHWVELAWWRRDKFGHMRNRGVQRQLIPSQSTTWYLNGIHAWPINRRKKREIKRRGSKTRRRLLNLLCLETE